MSFEGYYQVLCTKGHVTDIDCYEEPILSKELCPPFMKPEETRIWTCFCGSKAAWWNLVDETNGSFAEDGITRIDGCVELRKNPHATTNCFTGGNTHILEKATYKIPETGGHKIASTFEEKSQASSAYQKYEQLLRKLHALDQVGKLDSEEADVIRDEMDDPWYNLSDEEQKELDQLSADLYKEDEVDKSGDKDLNAIYESRNTHCHHDGKKHSVPNALVKLVTEEISEGNFSLVKYVSSGGNTCYAQPVVFDGEVRWVDFWTAVED